MTLLMLAAPLRGPIFPDWLFHMTEQMRPAEDLSVSPAEYALRDLIPGWEPVRPLTDDEMSFGWSPHRLVIGGTPISGPGLDVPVMPMAWIHDWPDPPPVEPTGVPWGWWWRPRDPTKFGAWLILTKGRYKASFYSLATSPLTYAEHGNLDELTPMRALYTALRDREAERRGVDPTVLDDEARPLQRYAGPGGPPPAVDPVDRAKLLLREDRVEEALALLAPLAADDVGTLRTRARIRLRLGQVYLKLGDFEAAKRTYAEARPLAAELGWTEVVDGLADEIAELEPLGPLTPLAQRTARAITSEHNGNLDGARQRLEGVLAEVDPQTEGETAFTAHQVLARVEERAGDLDAARRHARAALALEEAKRFTDEAAELRALLERLDAPAR